MSEFDVTVPPSAPRGRTIKFTPERLQQIKTLVERGMSREKIAETIGVTVGSLQVTCSRLGISLRRPRELTPMPPKRLPYQPGPASDPASVLEAPVVPPDARVCSPSRAATFALRIQRGDVCRDLPLPLTMDAVAAIAFAAEARGMQIGEMIAELVTAAIKPRMGVQRD